MGNTNTGLLDAEIELERDKVNRESEQLFFRLNILILHYDKLILESKVLKCSICNTLKIFITRQKIVSTYKKLEKLEQTVINKVNLMSLIGKHYDEDERDSLDLQLRKNYYQNELIYRKIYNPEEKSSLL